MKRLKVIDFGTEVQGIEINGDKRNPEPESVRVAFPGGDVDIVRTERGYWVHVRVNKEGDGDEDMDLAQITDARLDIIGRHASEVDCGEFNDPGLYHLAVLVSKDKTL